MGEQLRDLGETDMTMPLIHTSFAQEEDAIQAKMNNPRSATENPILVRNASRGSVLQHKHDRSCARSFDLHICPTKHHHPIMLNIK